MVQYDTDQMIFDEMVKLSISLISKKQLANQNRPKNYNITPFPSNIYISPSLSITTNHIFTHHQITAINIFFTQY